MATQRTERQQERAARHTLARSALYRLLSQSLAYPSQGAVAALQEVDLPQAQQAAANLSAQVAPLLATLGEHLGGADTAQLQAEHRRLFSHVMSLDCPPCETFYTARHIFQETQELGDIAGFFRAFGLEIADTERLDHISVELEFMYFLTYKEVYALTHHGRARARFCREAQLKFMQDHLGRWAPQFAQRLGQKAGAGYYGCVASLAEAFLSAEIGFLAAQPEAAVLDPHTRTTSPENFTCPATQGCP